MSQYIITPFPIEKEYEKKPQISEDDINKLREWLHTQPHLPVHLITDIDLALVYRCCDLSVEVSKQLLDLHFTLRTHYNFFKDRGADQLKAAFHTVLFAPLQTETPEGYKVIYIKLLDPDPKNYFMLEAVKAFFLSMDLWQLQQGSWPGLVIVIDLDGTSVGHLGRLDVMVLQHFLVFLQEAMLVKLKGFHYMNAPGFMDRLLALVRPFLNHELLSMFHIHSAGADSMYQYVPKDAFPRQCGGKYRTFEELRDEMWQRVLNNSTYLKEESFKRVDETQRVGKTKSMDSFSVAGTFKTLSID